MITEEIELIAPLETPTLPDDDGVIPGEPPAAQPEEAPRPNWRRRVVLGLVVLVGAMLGWGLLAVVLLGNGIERIPAADLPSLDAAGAGPVNYLLVGTDSREGLPEELGDFFGDFGGERADVIMLLHVADGRLQMVSLPRDLRVAIPGHGTERINASYAFGGPDLLVQTVQEATGLPIHHYLEVRFSDFANVVDSLGGVTIDFAYPSRDLKSGLNVDAGTQRLNGAQAVAYVRSRSFEELRDGDWVASAPGDIARTGRQQQVIDQLLGSAVSPGRFFTLPFTTSALGNSLRADEGLSMGTLARFGWSVVSADATETATLPSRNAPSGGVSYLAPEQPAAENLLARFGAGESLGE
ncbi:MAG: LCP family protein [Acidimicrobiia bacterium]|nr:LCP family protein [Acidimicrobiia bacterium]MBT8216067.1 LCP family protein [Acidimicrobiia bacterium]NNL70456.1 LCP family protein [Acidimicrobiia bacterium]